MANVRRQQIGISGSYGGANLGDEAILQGMIGELRSSAPCEITVFTRSSADTLQRHGVEHAVEVHELTRDRARSEVQKLDLLILGDGGILYDRDVELYLREVMLAHELGIPVFVYAVSAGPLETRSAREAVQQGLGQAAVITVRDRQGKRLLEDVGVTNEIHVTADPALLIQPEPLPEDCLLHEGLADNKRLAAFSVREPGPAAPDIDEEHYHSLLANAADFIVERLEADVIFVPLERVRDTRNAHAVMARMRWPTRAAVLRGHYTSGQLVSLLARVDFALGMRLHFLIFAALAHIPFVALPYASKVTGFIESLEMSMPPLKSINAGRLIAYIDRCWDSREDLRRRIQEKLPALQSLARKTNVLVEQLMSGQVINP